MDELTGPRTGRLELTPRTFRRTTTIDGVWPDGLRGQQVLTGRGRDVWVGDAGASRAIGRAHLRASTAPAPDYLVTSLATSEQSLDTTALVGRSARSGFRPAVRAVLPADLHDASVGALLHEIPNAASLSRLPHLHQGGGSRLGSSPPRLDVCAGWRADGHMAVAVADGRHALLTAGAAAVDVEASDPARWHPVARLGTDSFRRSRLIDITPVAGAFTVAAWFRDAYGALDGSTMAVHEYAVAAGVAPDGTILTCEAAPGVLPAPECPAAAASATSLRGALVTEIATHLGSLPSTATCTHLTSLLTAIAAAWRFARANVLELAT